TGRTHQIRVHLSGIRKPVFGDPTYGGRQINYGSDQSKIKTRVQNLLDIMLRQALHAKTVGFYHPQMKKKMFFNSELPNDIKLLLENIRTK
ncbi:MAG: RluA family pseudouridine synthase, partial [Ignavibacteriaceae bacterium]|nr:RluA family pseudouridine synthase [Ignavibacteriaceae bacterium]